MRGGKGREGGEREARKGGRGREGSEGRAMEAMIGAPTAQVQGSNEAVGTSLGGEGREVRGKGTGGGEGRR